MHVRILHGVAQRGRRTRILQSIDVLVFAKFCDSSGVGDNGKSGFRWSRCRSTTGYSLRSLRDQQSPVMSRSARSVKNSVRSRFQMTRCRTLRRYERPRPRVPSRSAEPRRTKRAWQGGHENTQRLRSCWYLALSQNRQPGPPRLGGPTKLRSPLKFDCILWLLFDLQQILKICTF
jgi:hypothetical protein